MTDAAVTLTDAELIANVRSAHEALYAHIEAAERAGLTVRLDVAKAVQTPGYVGPKYIVLTKFMRYVDTEGVI